MSLWIPLQLCCCGNHHQGSVITIENVMWFYCLPAMLTVNPVIWICWAFLILRTEMVLRHLSNNTNTNPGRGSSLIYKCPSKGKILHFPVVALAVLKTLLAYFMTKSLAPKQRRWCDSTALLFVRTWYQDTGAAILWWGNKLWPDHWVQECNSWGTNGT